MKLGMSRVITIFVCFIVVVILIQEVFSFIPIWMNERADFYNSMKSYQKCESGDYDHAFAYMCQEILRRSHNWPLITAINKYNINGRLSHVFHLITDSWIYTGIALMVMGTIAVHTIFKLIGLFFTVTNAFEKLSRMESIESRRKEQKRIISGETISLPMLDAPVSIDLGLSRSSIPDYDNQHLRQRKEYEYISRYE